jgi:hypothetical protein
MVTGNVHLSRIGTNICKCVKDMGEIFDWQLPGEVFATIYGPVDEVCDASVAFCYWSSAHGVVWGWLQVWRVEALGVRVVKFLNVVLKKRYLLGLDEEDEAYKEKENGYYG